MRQAAAEVISSSVKPVTAETQLRRLPYGDGTTEVRTKVYKFDIWYEEAVKGSPVSRYGDIASRDGKAALGKSSNGQFYVLKPID